MRRSAQHRDGSPGHRAAVGSPAARRSLGVAVLRVARDRRDRGPRGTGRMVLALLVGLASCAEAMLVTPRAEAAGDDGRRPAAGAAAPSSAFGSESVAVEQPVTLPAGAADRPPDPAAARQPLPGAGTGWLGMTADDSLVTGRVSVVDVAADGPAARAGIRPQDVLLELDGKPLRHEEDLAAALAAIAPGQRVTAAVGRENRIEETVLTAAPRPADPRTRPWPAATPAPPPALAAEPAAPPPQLAAGRSVLVPTAPATSVVVPVGGEERAPIPVPAAPPAIAPPAVPTAPAWGGAPAAAVRSPAVVAVPPAVTAAVPPALPAPAPSPAVSSPPGTAAVSAWGGAPAPAAGATSRVSEPPRFASPAALPAAVAPTFSQSPSAPAVRNAPPAAPGRLALGVRTVPVDGATQSRFRLSETGGALVIGVVHDLPASRAGVPPGSVIVALNNVPVRSPQELTLAVSGGTPGVPVPIQYVLPGGESRRADVVLVPLEASLERALAGPTAAAESAAGLPVGGPAPTLTRRIVEPPLLTAPPAPVGAVLAGGAVPSPPTAPLDGLEALLRRINERLDAVERRLERIERLGR